MERNKEKKRKSPEKLHYNTSTNLYHPVFVSTVLLFSCSHIKAPPPLKGIYYLVCIGWRKQCSFHFIGRIWRAWKSQSHTHWVPNGGPTCNNSSPKVLEKGQGVAQGKWKKPSTHPLPHPLPEKLFPLFFQTNVNPEFSFQIKFPLHQQVSLHLLHICYHLTS